MGRARGKPRLTGGIHLTPEQAKRLPEAVHTDFLQAFAHALHGVFLWGMLLAVVPFGLAWLLKEVPLRTTLGRPAEDVAAVEAASGAAGAEAIVKRAADAAAAR